MGTDDTGGGGVVMEFRRHVADKNARKTVGLERTFSAKQRRRVDGDETDVGTAVTFVLPYTMTKRVRFSRPAATLNGIRRYTTIADDDPFGGRIFKRSKKKKLP